MREDLERVATYFNYFNENAGSFYRGDNDRGWKADFKYICRESTITKAREANL